MDPLAGLETSAREEVVVAEPPAKKARKTRGKPKDGDWLPSGSLKVTAPPPPVTPAPVTRSAPHAPPARPKAASASEAEGEERSLAYWQLRAFALSEDLQPLLHENKIHLEVSHLRHWNEAKIKEILEDVNDVLDKSLQSSLVDNTTKQGMHMLEELIHQKTPLKLRGSTDAMYKDPKWRALYARFKINHDLGIRPQNPTLELLVTSCALMQQAHALNTGKVSSDSIDLSRLSEA